MSNIYGITENSEVRAVPNRGSFSTLVDGKVMCSMSSGGALYYSTKLEAEVMGRRYCRGFTGSVYLSADVANFVEGF